MMAEALGVTPADRQIFMLVPQGPLAAKCAGVLIGERQMSVHMVHAFWDV